MKRTIAIILALLLTLSMVACGEQNNDSTTNNTVSSTQDDQQNNNTEDKTDDYQADSSLPGVVRANYNNVQYCVDAPSEQIYNRGPLFVNMKNYFVIYDQYKDPSSKLNYGVDISKITSASNVIEGMEIQFAEACEEGLIIADEYRFTLTKKEDKQINAYQMSRFEGTMELVYKIDNPDVEYTSVSFVGYSLVKDGCPVYFVVVDIPTEGGVDDIGTMADKIARTFREYSED